jgi:hypothetical protein
MERQVGRTEEGNHRRKLNVNVKLAQARTIAVGRRGAVMGVSLHHDVDLTRPAVACLNVSEALVTAGPSVFRGSQAIRILVTCADPAYVRP